MTQVLHLSSRWNKLLIFLFIVIQSIVSFSGIISPHNLEMFSITHNKLTLFVVGFPTTPFDPFPKDAFSSSFVAEAGIFFSILFFNYLSSISFFRRHCDVALFNPSACFVNIMIFSCLSFLTGLLCPLLKFFSSYQVFLLRSVRMLPKLYQSYSFSI